MLMLYIGVHPLCTRCTPLVHNARQRRRALDGDGLSLRVFGRWCRVGLRFLAFFRSAGQGLGRDEGAGYVIRAFPAVLVLAGDRKDLLPGAGLAEPGHIGGGDVALAVGRGAQQAQVIVLIFLISAGSAAPPQARPGPAARGARAP